MSTTITQTIAQTPIASKYAWEAGPMKLIPTPRCQTGATDVYTMAASEMALVHNCIIRAMNSIYLQATHIKPADQKSFVSYGISVFDGLSAHHKGEEEMFFPELERLTGVQGIMDVNISQHEAFHSGFENWGNWLRNVQAGKATWDGKACMELMDSFTGPLSVHLADEIPSILSLAQYKDKFSLEDLWKQEGDKVMSSMSKTTQLPMFLMNHDDTFEGGIHHFPPIPAPVTWVLKNVFGKWNADWWKFAACGFDGKPRALYAGAAN